MRFDRFTPALSRRDLLWRLGGGLGGVALTHLLGHDGLLAGAPAPRKDLDGGPHHRAQPAAQGADGRDHNITGYPMWLTGAGVKKGFTYGATDEYGQKAVEGSMHSTDLHATLLALLGLDHERLTYRYGGRDFRLTDVKGHVVEEIFA